CYMGTDKVVGFGHQFIEALMAPPPKGPDAPAAQPGPRIMHGADPMPFQALRAKMESEWTPQVVEVLGPPTPADYAPMSHNLTTRASFGSGRANSASTSSCARRIRAARSSADSELASALIYDLRFG